jgi:hypothetical protein
VTALDLFNLLQEGMLRLLIFPDFFPGSGTARAMRIGQEGGPPETSGLALMGQAARCAVD